MRTIPADGFIPSPAFAGIPGIVAGFTTRSLGDMRDAHVRQSLARSLGFDCARTVYPVQIHGTALTDIRPSDIGTVVAGVDGVEADPAAVGTVLLFVHVGDCVPVLVRDAKTGRIAAFHAGWKGTLGGIAGNAVRGMQARGADPRSMTVSLGPHIGRCCYTVPEDRAAAFADRFGAAAVAGTGPQSLDLTAALIRDLTDAGVAASSIDTSAAHCTYCTDDGHAFYSYRRDTDETFGEIAGVIGYNEAYG